MDDRVITPASAMGASHGRGKLRGEMDGTIPGLAERTVDVGGVRWRCQVGGEGPPVVLLHGWPETGWTWRKVVAPLLDHRTVFVPDLPGWGGSDKPADYPYSVAGLVSEVPAFARAAGIDGRFALVGHDWGAAAAISLAIERPEILERVVWVNLGPELLNPIGPWHMVFMNLPSLPEWVLSHRLRTFVERIFRWWAADRSAFGPEEIEVYTEALSRPGAREATLQYYRSVRAIAPQALKARWSGTAIPARLEVPLLVLWGDRDPIAHVEDAHRLANRLPEARVVIVPGAGHFPQEERPEVVSRELAAFLAPAQRTAGPEVLARTRSGSLLGE